MTASRFKRSVGIVGFALTFLVLVTGCGRPSDQAVVAQMESASPAYDALLAMLGQDPKVGTIGESFLFQTGKSFSSTDAQTLGITEERVSEYRRLLKVAGARRVDRLDSGGIQFSLWARGFAGNTHHKGLVWSMAPLSTNAGWRFTHIRGNWYCYED